MRVPPWVVCVFPWGIHQLQSDWSLSCDHGLDYASYCENNNNNNNNNVVQKLDFYLENVRAQIKGQIKEEHEKSYVKARKIVRRFYFFNRVFALKYFTKNSSIMLKKGQLHSGMLLVVFAVNESQKRRTRPPCHRRGAGGQHLNFEFRHGAVAPRLTDRAGPAQPSGKQQHSSSSGGGGGGGDDPAR